MAMKSPAMRSLPSCGLDPNGRLIPRPQQTTPSPRIPQVSLLLLLMALNSPSGVKDASTPQQEGVPSAPSAQT